MATTDVVKREMAKSETQGLRGLIEKSAKELARCLPNHMKPERLVRIALTCIRQNPQLAECTQESFLGALFVSAQLGLEPVAGLAYILPFNNSRKVNGEWKTVKEAQFVAGYRGLASLFYNHEKSLQLDWGIVHEKDDFSYEHGTNAFLRHKPASGERGSVQGFYVIAGLQGGGKVFRYMSLNECMEHGKKHSKTYDKEKKEFNKKSPWHTTPEAMCLKTVLIQLAKLLPLSIEVQQAIQADETSRDYRAGIDNALDLKETTTWEETTAEKTGESQDSQAAAPVTSFLVSKVTTTEKNGVKIYRVYIGDTPYDTSDAGMAKTAKEWAENKVPMDFTADGAMLVEIRKV